MAPSDWPNPPWVEHLFLESPWAMVLVLGALAGAMLFVGDRRGNRRMQLGAILPALAAVGVVLLARSVVTDREMLVLRTRALLDAVADPYDIEQLRGLTTANLRLIRTPGEYSRDQLLEVGRRATESNPVGDYATLGRDIRARVDGPRYGKSYFNVLVGVHIRQSAHQQLVRVEARLNWEKGDDGLWRVNAIEQMTINEQSLLSAIRYAL